MLFLLSCFSASKETGTVGKFKTLVLIPLFCWINIHTCHSSKSFREVSKITSLCIKQLLKGENLSDSNCWTYPERDSNFFINSYITMLVVMRGWFSWWREDWGYSRFLNTFAFISNFCKQQWTSIETERGMVLYCHTLLWVDRRSKDERNNLEWNLISLNVMQCVSK